MSFIDGFGLAVEIGDRQRFTDRNTGAFRCTSPAVLRAQLDHLQVHWNTVRLHAGVGYVTRTTNTAVVVSGFEKDREAGLERARQNRRAHHRANRRPDQQHHPEGPRDVV